ncbi:amidase, partial [Brevibacterium paucivorans]|uniref:amidase n=1 Tax=Brevibacterium paucivorans TaxID=170994 RepID=UPI0021559DF3
MSATRGSQALQGKVAEKDAEIIARLKQAGAIPFGRTTTPEMSCATFTHTREWGVTR